MEINEKNSAGEAENESSIYNMINCRIIEQFNKGVKPWKQGWNSKEMPRNLISGNKYRGINFLLLSILGYERTLYLTGKQIKEIGGALKEDEKGYPVAYLKIRKRKEGSRKPPVLRYYFVYNIAQCTGIPVEKIPPLESRNLPLERAKEIVERMPDRPEIILSEMLSFYSPEEDRVNELSKEKYYATEEDYYLALLRNLVRSTGHSKRLGWESKPSMFTLKSLFYEDEVIAEIGKYMFRVITGLEGSDDDRSDCEIMCWLGNLKNDNTILVRCASVAQRAVDYILSAHPAPESEF